MQRLSVQPSNPDIIIARHRHRLNWLIGLRWWAMAATVAAATLALNQGWDFVSPPALAFGVLLGVVFNGILYIRVRMRDPMPQELALHALADIIALTWLLAFSGGLSNPLSVAYAFHVVIGALLAQRKGALAAFFASLLGMFLLWTLEHQGFLPVRPLEHIPISLWWASLLLLISGVGYFSLVIARQLNAQHAQVVKASERASSNLQVLLSVLDNQAVGIEMMQQKGRVLFANSFGKDIKRHVQAEEKIPNELENAWFCPGSKGMCRQGPMSCALGEKHPPTNRCHFQVMFHEEQKFFEMIFLEASAEVPYDLALYVDRTETLLLEQKHLQLEQMVALGRTLQGFAHELNTPLMTLNTLTQDISSVIRESELNSLIQKDVLESLHLASTELSRCQRLTQGLLKTAELTGNKPSSYFNLEELIGRAIQLASIGKGKKKIRFNWDASRCQQISLEQADSVFQIILNLLQNAVYALVEMSHDEPAIQINLVEKGEYIELWIEDNGAGLSQKVRGHLFEPFTTSKPASEGTGLGLYTSLLLAKKLGGDLLVQNLKDQGVGACLKIPLKYINKGS